jgi:RNA polymerase sigma-70 factor (ECF subfamily)
MKQQELIPHLFRTEFSKIAAVLCKYFGTEHIEIAEDIASETFLAALESWTYKGIPENPVAWLYTVAKNKARNYIYRNDLFDKIIAPSLKKNSEEQELEIDLSDKNIMDSQLQMLFTLCHPGIPTEAQVGLSLRILCGFGIEEIANAFLTNKETINKRLFRAREKLRQQKLVIEFPGNSEINKRLETVLMTLYLLYSEGYYSESQDTILRKDLCAESMRLTYLLIQHEQTSQPTVHALFALMCFHTSRFEARENKNGEMILYQEQDETLWNSDLINRGIYHLNVSAQGNKLSKYHLEAGIAYWHTIKADTKDKWENILQLYNQLLQLEYSPIAALNRTYALSKANGKEEAIIEAEKLNLADNRFYYSLLGELYTDCDNKKAEENYQKALRISKTSAERKVILKKIDGLSKGS